MSRTFTLDEANALVPEVARALLRTTQLLGQARAIGRRLARAGAEVSPLNPSELLDVPDDPALEAEAARAKLLLAVAQEEAARLTAQGVLVKDLERGLVDFRTILDGEREVYLCWRLGEPSIQYFHGVHDGFVGRRSVEGHRFFRRRQLVPPRTPD